MFYIIIGLMMALLAVIFVKTVLFSSQQITPEKVVLEEIDIQNASQRLSKAIQVKTISVQDYSKNESFPFLEFHHLLEQLYPALHKTLEKTVVNTCSLVYKWQGKNSHLDPIAFLAHIDVVPVEPGTEKDWSFDPFSGEIAEGFIWGRGTLDMKGTLMAIMESVEMLVEKKFQPERSIYLAFGHDEEIGGNNGAAKIAVFLEKQGIRFSYTLDEGMVVLDKQISPCKRPLGIIGIAEKGYVTLKLESKGQGGHSSVPPSKTTIGNLCRAYTRLEANQMAAVLTDPVKYYYQTIGPDMPFFKKMLHANSWFFKPLILYLLGKSETTNAMIRTTNAPTIIHGGIKENILPSSAYMLVNFRIIPGDTIQKLMARVKRIINDASIKIETCDTILSDPPPVSGIQAEGFLNIEKTICQVFPETIVTPGLAYAMTDSRHYAGISDNCYRFAPFAFNLSDLPRIHGTNERVSIKGYARAIQYYLQLIKNSAGMGGAS